MLINERVCLEHITAATAALDQPGGGRARLWQRQSKLATTGGLAGGASAVILGAA